jgi:hypothetical protein
MYFVAVRHNVVRRDVGNVEFLPLECGHTCFTDVPIWEEEGKLYRNFT